MNILYKMFNYDFSPLSYIIVMQFAFTATPKETTLRLFGRPDKNGDYVAFHLYSMKQAIEEGFILDVLANYTTYKTIYKLNKNIVDDPTIPANDAKRQIARYIDLHDDNITQSGLPKSLKVVSFGVAVKANILTFGCLPDF